LITIFTKIKFGSKFVVLFELNFGCPLPYAAGSYTLPLHDAAGSQISPLQHATGHVNDFC
jgi:hypothetical protein